MSNPTLDRALLLTIAGEASADPRSVARVLAGERLRGMADARVRRVLVQRGIDAPTPAPLALATGVGNAR